MPKDIKWKIPLIVAVIAIALYAIYPPFEKPIKTERIKEINGKVVEREIVESSWVRFLVSNPTVTETILSESTDDAGVTTVEKIVEYKARGQIKLGLDLKGGSELLYEVRVNKNEDRPGLTKEIIQVLQKRIDPNGILEYRIQEQGHHRILIQVPGATQSEITAFKKRLTRLGKLEFRLAATRDSDEYRRAASGEKVPGYYKHWIRKARGEVGESDDWYLVSNKTEITGEHLARVFPDRKDIQAVVGFEFDQVGKAKFGKLTERNIGKPLAIILDGILYSAPAIRDRIPGKGIIEGGFSQEEVNDLVAIMRAGSLPADLELEMETTVGPSLGKDSITSGLRAGLVAAIFVLLFMGIFYLGVGWVANFALALNILLILGALVIVSATITLPGLAGLVLTIGIAVDANVLIFERIREEKNAGRPIKLAIKNGYERAFVTIFDANLTTMITAIILAAVGTGPVKGFAWVLIIGLLVNMFTAILVTRTIYNVLAAKRWITKFHMLNFFSNTAFPFVRFRNIAVPISIVLIVGGLTIFIIRGDDNYDIDFTGGTLAQLHLKNPTSVEYVRNTLSKNEYPNAEVQGLWTGGSAVVKTLSQPTDFGIRIKELNKKKVKGKIADDIKRSMRNNNVDCNLTFVNSTEFNISVVGRPVEETTIQKALADAGYGSKDIISVEPAKTASSHFAIIVTHIDNFDTKYSMLKSIAGYLGNDLLSSQITLAFGKMTESNTSGRDTGNYFAGTSILELNLNMPVDHILLQMEMNKAGFKDITINKRDSSRSALTTKMEIGGPRDVLQEIKKKMSKSLSIPAIAFINSTTITLNLAKSVLEGTLRNDLTGISEIAGYMQKLLTLNVKAHDFIVRMRPLRTGKIQEKIQDDIVVMFMDKIEVENIKVTIRKSDELVDNDSGATSLKMKLSTHLTKEKIEAVLINAGYPDLLADNLITGKSYDLVNLRAETANLETIINNIENAFVIPMPLKKIVSIGAAVAGEMKGRAILALICACFAIIVYVWYRFGEFKFGAAAVVALIHDVLITLGAVAVADHYGYIFGDIKLNLPMVAAFLTLVGYSLNDTIVLFDRIRENVGSKKKTTLDAALIDKSINQNLNRTLITSLTTLGVLMSLYFIGGPEIHGFAFVMMVGVVVGTYSSMFIASPILVNFKKNERTNK
ncbi:MAG: protein translocase subunit SecD [Candidatus Anammoxibacter sp.]